MLTDSLALNNNQVPMLHYFTEFFGWHDLLVLFSIVAEQRTYSKMTVWLSVIKNNKMEFYFILTLLSLILM